MNYKDHKFEIWCQLYLSNESERMIHDFFIEQYYIDRRYLVKGMHITVYHSRRPMLTLNEQRTDCGHIVDTLDTRFMVMAPGGENPHPNLVPARRKVGIRIHRQSEFRSAIDAYRNEVLIYEDRKTLGARKPSTRTQNAFGSRYFQPHMSILKAGSGIMTDLSIVGNEFREQVHELVFNQYVIQRAHVV